MDNIPFLGKTLVSVGLVIAAVGAILMLGGKMPWLGRLPGDIYIRKDNFSFYFPLATGLLLSLLLTLILNLFFRK